MDPHRHALEIDMKEHFSGKQHTSFLIRTVRCLLIGLTAASIFLVAVASTSFARSSGVDPLFTQKTSKLLIPTISNMGCGAGVNGNPKIPNATLGKSRNIGGVNVPTYDMKLQHLSSSCAYGVVWVKDKKNNCNIGVASKIGVVNIGVTSNIDGKSVVTPISQYQLDGSGSNQWDWIDGTQNPNGFILRGPGNHPLQYAVGDVSSGNLYDLPQIKAGHIGIVTIAPIYYSCSK